jgi:multiple antibiotic resistance protein
MDFALLFHTSFLFLIVMDPIGNIPVFVGVLSQFDPKQQTKIIFRELLIALIIMLVCFFFGRGFFALLAIEQSSMQIAGSTTLFLIGVKMLFSTPKSAEKIKKNQEPFIVPLATPAVAGPAISATIMLYAGNQEISHAVVLLSIIIAWLCLVPCLLASPFIKRVFKENGVIAAERLFAYLVILVAMQMAITGIKGTFAV